MACEVAAQSDEVPPLQSYVESVFAFRERISHGEITRRIHLETWHVYMRTTDGVTDHTQSEMDEMFARMRDEIDGMERRSKEFKSMVDALVRMVAGMREIAKLRLGEGGAGAGGLQIRPDGFVNVNGFWVRSSTRIPTYSAHRRDAAGARARARAMTRSPSDLLPNPILANSRARLPPLTGIHPSPPPPSPLPTAGSATNFPRRLPASILSASRTRWQQAVVAPPSAEIRPEILRPINLPSSRSRSRRSRSRSPPPPPSPPLPPPWNARNIHRRLFQRVFHASQNSNPASQHRPRTPSPPAARAPSPLGTATPLPQPSGSGFSSYESPSGSLIAETRTRLPPSPDLLPIPYRPPGQRLFSFLHRL